MYDTHYIVAVYRRQATAQEILQRLVDKDFPMDRISLLGKAGAVGDDVLGVYYPKLGERMKAWGEQGAFWGAIWGLLASASGLFVFPGLGAIAAVGPIVQLLVASLAGAGLTGGALAAAGALSQISVILHRIGIPHEKLEELHQDILTGKTLIILQGHADELQPYQKLLTTMAEKVFDLHKSEWIA